jgi:excinuclease UvrABC nuclease subunit
MTGGLEFGTSLPTALYRFFAKDDRLLYVGVTDDLKSRLAAHATQKSWWGEVSRTTVEWFPGRLEALDAEIAAIQSERPAYNIAHADSAPREPRDADAEARTASLASLGMAVACRLTASFLTSYAEEVADMAISLAAKQAGVLEQLAARMDVMADKGGDPVRYLERIEAMHPANRKAVTVA